MVDMIDSNGGWDWNRISAALPGELVDRIAAVPPRGDAGSDKMVWWWESNHKFTTRRLYGGYSRNVTPLNAGIWTRVWNIPVPQRVCVFVWLVFHGRLLSNAERVRRHISDSKLCDFCGVVWEDIEHVLRSCCMAKGVWMRSIPAANRHTFFNHPFTNWLYKNLFDNSFMVADMDWSTRFAIMCWLLWKRRCRHISDLELCDFCGAVREDVEHVLRSCCMAKGVWMRSIPAANRHTFFNLFDNSFMVADMDWSTRFAIMCWLLWKCRCRLVLAPEKGYMGDILARARFAPACCSKRWEAPPRGWVKLNVDDAVSPMDSKASVGGVFRDDKGRWLHGFARYIGRCDALFAKLWAIHDGLIQAWESGFSQVVFESDCLEATCVVNSSSDALASSALVSLIKDLLTRDWQVVVRHVSQVRNRVADLLAARGLELGMNQSIFYNPLADVANVIEEELLVLHSNVSEAVGIG
ncbi:hypothetical protein GQ457_10G009460 [Hibiscus cannabinus]